jgi:hypothetical protein
MHCGRLTAMTAAALLGASAAATAYLEVNVHAWRIIPRESGRVNYYSVVDDVLLPHIHAAYAPGYETAVLGFEVPHDQARAFHHLKWAWRADVLPRGGDECARGAEDSAAVVYVTWKRGLRWYSLKYVWSAVGTKGRVCDSKRNLFVAQDTIILETGAPVGVWRTESIDIDAAFRERFGDQDVPELQGLALMTDGDQTRSESVADYGAFVLSP